MSAACQWCGEPAVRDYEISPERYGKAGLKRAVVAPVCQAHFDRFEAERRALMAYRHAQKVEAAERAARTRAANKTHREVSS